MPVHHQTSPHFQNLLSPRCPSRTSLPSPVPQSITHLSLPEASSARLVPASHIPAASHHLTSQILRQLPCGNKGQLFSFSVLWLIHTCSNHRLWPHVCYYIYSSNKKLKEIPALLGLGHILLPNLTTHLLDVSKSKIFMENYTPVKHGQIFTGVLNSESTSSVPEPFFHVSFLQNPVWDRHVLEMFHPEC